MDKFQMIDEMYKNLQKLTALLMDNDANIQKVSTLFNKYQVGIYYQIGDIFTYGDNNACYKVLQSHKSQADWQPDKTPALYKLIGSNDDGYLEWKQPLGAHDAYGIGDIVEYNGKLYKSLINGNVWSPDVYAAGWEIYTEPSGGGGGGETPTEPETPPETIPDFVQPTGAHDAYKKGDKVKYNGKIYESLIDGNVHSPDAYPAGWKEVTA